MLLVPPPVKVRAPILIELLIFWAAELLTVKAPEPVRAPKAITPLPLFKEEVPLTVVAPKVRLLFVVLIVPLTVVVVAFEVKPLVKFKVELPEPKTTFVLLKTVGPVSVLLVPSNLTA